MKLKSIAKNQTEIRQSNGDQIFFSYETPVAAYVDGFFYRTDKHWSATTTRHINNWLCDHDAKTKPQSFFDNLV